MKSLLSQMSAFASNEKTKAIELARQLGNAAKARRDAGEGEQPEPELFQEHTAELRAWRDAYGGKGRKSQWPMKLAGGGATIAESSSKTQAGDAGFALVASSRKPMNPRAATTTKTSKPKATIADHFVDVGKKVYTSTLSKAHHSAANGWDDAERCLEWAAEQGATVREMVAWRSLQAIGKN